MRVLALFALLGSLACQNITRPVSKHITGPVTNGSPEPLTNLSGQWSAPYSVPGSSLAFELSQAEDSLHGTGTYAIEAGRAGTVELRGSFHIPNVELVLQYDYGPRWLFKGEVQDSRMVGTVTDSAGHVLARTFVKQ